VEFVADESVDRFVVQALRGLGHHVMYVCEESPSSSDDLVLERATCSGVLLITADKDFGERVYRQRKATSGVLPLRLAGLSSEHKARLVLGVVTSHADEFLGAFSVVTAKKVRIRHLFG
jgi:predicted nuclease of predicted toxin-antitoxin system